MGRLDARATLSGFLSNAPAAYLQSRLCRVAIETAESTDFRAMWFRLEMSIARAVGLAYPIIYDLQQAIDHATACVRLTELRLLREGVADEIRVLEKAGCQPIRASIVQQPRDKIYDRYLETFVRLADGAGLAVTPAWAQVPRNRK
jgi:hypothetical protein